MKKEIIYNGREYLWDGSNWYDSGYMKVETSVACNLDKIIHDELIEADKEIKNLDKLIDLIQKSRNAGYKARSWRLLDQALELDPNHIGLMIIKSSMLRERGRPLEALEATAPYKSRNSSALHTTRAAALCDLDRWEEAKSEISRALAINASGEAFSVVRRIKVARSDLYEESN